MPRKLVEKNHPLAFVSNTDETLIFFDLVSDKVVDTVGAKSVMVKMTDNYICKCGSYSYSQWGNASTIQGKRQLKLLVPEGIGVKVQELGWINEELMKGYIDTVWVPYIQ